MKAISLHQPYASLVATGAKLIETRSWPTKYLGLICIHAGLRRNTNELIGHGSCWGICAGLRVRMGSPESQLWTALPFGAIVAVANIVDCRLTDTFTNAELDTHYNDPDRALRYLGGWRERWFGDYSLGRYGWVLSDVVKLEYPVPVSGMQRIFEIPVDVESLVREQITGVVDA